METRHAYLLAERLATQRAGKAVILVVSSQVGHHVALLRKAFATHLTSVRLLFRMDTAFMCLQVAPLSEPLRTVTAAVVLLSGVYLHVGVHVTLLSEAFATDLQSKGD